MSPPGLGYRIRERREALQMKATILARRAGISRSYLDQLESLEGKNPSAEVLYRVACELNTTMEYLLGVPALNVTGSDQEGELPMALKVLQTRRGWSDEEVRVLARIQINGDRPRSEDDWVFLLEAIRRSVKPDSRGRDY